MRVRLNVRLLVGTILSLTLVGTGIHFLHGYQVKRNAGVMLRDADLAIQQAENQKDHALRQKTLDQGITLLAWYLTYEPGDKQALAKYGLLLEKQATTRALRLQAMQKLEEALRADPSRDDVRFRLANCLINLLSNDRLPAAINHLMALQPRWKQPGEIEHMLGWCYEARGDYPQAAEWFGRAIASSANRLESYILLADVLHNRLDQSDEAGQILDKMVAANANWYQAYVERARFYQGRGQADDADKDIARAVELAPDNESVLLAAAESAQARSNWKKARDIVQRGLVRHPQQASLYKALAALEIRSGRDREAIACLQRGIDKVPQARELQVLLADLFIDEGKLDRATELITELHKENFPSALPDYLQARLLMAEKKWGPAANLLERCRQDLGPASEWTGRVNFSLGACYGRLGDLDQQLAAYERALLRDPGWPAARIGLGSALLSAGRIDEALLQFRALEQGVEAPEQLWPLLARTLLLRTLRLPAWQRDWPPAEKAIDKVFQVRPDSQDVPLLRAEVLFAQGKPQQADELLVKASRNKAGTEAIWSARAELAARQQKWSEAMAILDEGQKQLGDKLELRLARMRLWAQRGGEKARVALAELGREAGSLAPEEKIIFDRALAETWSRLENPEQARALWKGLADKLPHDLQCRFALFELALKKGQVREANALWQEIQRLDGPAGILSQYGKAALEVVRASNGDKAALAEARRTLAGLGHKRADWSRIQLLEARIAELDGNANKAIDHYLRAVELGERQPRLARHLSGLLFAKRRYQEADQVLRWLEEAGPLNQDLSRLGAEIALAQNDSQRALSLARQAASPESRDYRQLLWLARILDAGGESAAAETVLRRAVSLAGHNPDTWVALVQHLARKNQVAAADAVLDQARKKLPADRLDLTLARCLEVLGRLDQAEVLFARTVSSRPADFIALDSLAQFYLRGDRPEKAESPLRRLLEPAVAAPADIAASARRFLAVALASRNTSRDRQEALDLLDQNSKLLGKNISDDRARAMVMAAQKEQRSRAVQLFEQTLQAQAVTSIEQLWLVELYQSATEHDKARDWLLGMLVQESGNPQYLAHYVRILLDQGQATEAQQILRRLEHVDPVSARTLELKAAVAGALQAPDSP